MIEEKLNANNMSPENFKDFVLKLERDNLKNLNKEDKKSMVSKIIRTYEEGKKSDN